MRLFLLDNIVLKIFFKNFDQMQLYIVITVF